MKIGVLALQGGFIEHIKMLLLLEIEYFEIRQKKDIKSDFDGLIIPGGESTVMGKLLRELELYDALKFLVEDGFPVFGTCAGLIMLARNIENEHPHFATMDITVKRNAYGRQLGSFHTESEFAQIGKIPMTFIRAPYIESASDNVEILASVHGKAVAARQDAQLVTAFHPELTDDLSVHKYFCEVICGK